MKQDEKVTKTRKLELKVNSGKININGIITGCADQWCIYAEHQEDSGDDENN